MKLGTETDSVINHIYANSIAVWPQIGMGCTELCWTDRHAGTIVRVTRTQIHVQRDIATRVDGNGMSESQEYSYAPDKGATVCIFRWTKRGYRNSKGNGLLVGVRKEYHDYSF